MIEAESLWELVIRRAEATPDALFAIDEADRTLTFKELRDQAEQVAAGLYEQGMREGDPVSWILPTRISAFVLMVALARLGAVQNPLVPIYRRSEVEFCVRQTRARWLLVPEVFRGFDYLEMAREVAAAVADLGVLEIGDVLPTGHAPLLPAQNESPTGQPPPIRWIFYTSGTTSLPKGAQHTDATVLLSSRALVTSLDLSPGSRTGVVFPVTHLGGANALASTLQAGSTQLVVEIFDPPSTVPFLARHGVTHAGAGPVFYQAYLEAQRASGSAPIFPDLCALYGGGAPTSESLHRAARNDLGGLGILSTYGMTECPIITMARWDDPPDKRCTTEGRPTHPATTVTIVDAAGRNVATGEEGEILVRAPQCMLGFVDAELDAEAFTRDRFLRTGDLGRLDENGYLAVTGRKKDVIIRKGENISAFEIESLLGEHEAVAEVAVIGLADRARGEVCCAVVRAHDPAKPLDFEDMQSFLSARALMQQKIPERLEHVDVMPRNPSGKILKEQLRERYSTSVERADHD
jgi:cyclohexanecarboxylate-CoA ligase